MLLGEEHMLASFNQINGKMSGSRMRAASPTEEDRVEQEGEGDDHPIRSFASRQDRRILAGGEEAKLRATRRRGSDSKIALKRMTGEQYGLAPFAMLDMLSGTMTLNANLGQILITKQIITRLN